MRRKNLSEQLKERIEKMLERESMSPQEVVRGLSAERITISLSSVYKIRQRIRIKGPTHPDKRYYDHWSSLGRIAEELMIGLEFPRLGEGQFKESSFGGCVWGAWFIDRPSEEQQITIHFSAQEKDLWKYFIRHIEAEFPSFSVELADFQKTAGSLVSANPNGLYADQSGLRNQAKARAIRAKLWKVITRRTFKGTCAICEDWYI